MELKEQGDDNVWDFKLHGFIYYIGSVEGHEYPDLLVGDEVNPRTLFEFT